MCTKTTMNRCQERDSSPRTPVVPGLDRITQILTVPHLLHDKGNIRMLEKATKRDQHYTFIIALYRITVIPMGVSYNCSFFGALRNVLCSCVCVGPLHYTSQVPVLVATNVFPRNTHILHLFLHLHCKCECYIHMHRCYANLICNLDISVSIPSCRFTQCVISL